ncbi:MAG: hypothetical protein V3U45_05755, partial [bacterium]
ARKSEGIPKPVQPQTKIKVVWYALLSALGLFHAEVLSWSAPDVLYNPLTFALVAPVYVVHYVLFGDLMGRRQGDLKVLYLFGCLTGMYEFVITKVFWSPPWNPGAVGPLGVAWVETLWIGFTWHAFMTFLIPFFLMQALFTPGGRNKRSRGLVAIMVAAPVMSAVFGLGFGQSLSAMLVPLVLSFLVIVALAVLWLRWAPRWGFQGIDQLRFGRAGRRAALGAFIAVYVGYGIILRPEFFPLDLALVPFALLYAALLPLTAYYLRRASPSPRSAERTLPARPALQFLLLYLLAFLAVFLGLGALHALLPGVLPVVAVGIVVGSVAVPVIILGGLAFRALRDRRTRTPGLPGPIE